MKVLPFLVEMGNIDIAVSLSVSLQLFASVSKVALGVLGTGKIA